MFGLGTLNEIFFGPPTYFVFNLMRLDEILGDVEILLRVLEHPGLGHPLVPVLVPAVVVNQILGVAVLHLDLQFRQMI